jgi:hypothetical protein
MKSCGVSIRFAAIFLVLIIAANVLHVKRHALICDAHRYENIVARQSPGSSMMFMLFSLICPRFNSKKTIIVWRSSGALSLQSRGGTLDDNTTPIDICRRAYDHLTIEIDIYMIKQQKWHT